MSRCSPSTSFIIALFKSSVPINILFLSFFLADNLYDMLMLQWSNKTKEEKQEFISKFIENVTIDKNKKGSYELVNIKFRSSFIEQICKILDYGMFDLFYNEHLKPG